MTTAEKIAEIKSRADSLLRKAALQGDEFALERLLEIHRAIGASKGAEVQHETTLALLDLRVSP